MAKVMLAAGLVVAYGYGAEFFLAWFSGNVFESQQFWLRLTGPYWPITFMMLAFNVFIPQVLWLKKIRQAPLLLFLVALGINIGMWMERFVIIVTGLSRDFLPSSWEVYTPTITDFGVFIGTIGLFLAMLFLFIRLLPAISMFEMRELVAEESEAHE